MTSVEPVSVGHTHKLTAAAVFVLTCQCLFEALRSHMRACIHYRGTSVGVTRFPCSPWGPVPGVKPLSQSLGMKFSWWGPPLGPSPEPVPGDEVALESTLLGLNLEPVPGDEVVLESTPLGPALEPVSGSVSLCSQGPWGLSFEPQDWSKCLEPRINIHLYFQILIKL